MTKSILKQTIITVTIFFAIANSIYATPILTDWTNATSSSANGALGSISVTLSASSNTIFPPMFEGFSGFSNPSIYNPAIASSDAIQFLGDRGTVGFDYTVGFDSPVENPIIYIASLASILTFDSAVSLTKLSGEDVFTVSGNTVSGVTDDIKAQPNNDANGIFQINGVFTNFSFNAVWNFPTGDNDGIYMQIGGNVVSNPVPEPSSILLFASGIVGLWLHTERGRKLQRTLTGTETT